MSTHNDEIDLISIAKPIWKKRNLVFLTTTLFVFIGVLVALISPIEYKSSTTFIPQNSKGSNSSSLSGVASLVGINLGLGMNNNEIAPQMYPEISDSPKFKRMLLNKFLDNEKTVTLENFIINHYELDNLNDSKSDPMYVSINEEEMFNIISEIISISVNQKDGFVTINSVMPVAEYAAKCAKNAREILQDIIIKNKIESANQVLEFSNNQLSQRKLEFDEIQSKLSYFKDSNLNLVNSSFINEQEKLEAEFEIMSAVVTELSKQVEQAKLQVSRNTPVFSTIKEAVVPNKRIKPKRSQIVIIYAFIGLVFSISYVLLLKPTKDILKKISE